MDTKTLSLCEEVLENLADAVDGALPPHLDAHTLDCDTCRDAIHEARTALDRLQAVGERYQPNPELEAHVLQALDRRGEPVVQDAKAAPTQDLNQTVPLDSPPIEALQPHVPTKSETVRAVQPHVTAGHVAKAQNALPTTQSPLAIQPKVGAISNTRRRVIVSSLIALAAGVAFAASSLNSQKLGVALPGTIEASAPWSGKLTSIAGGLDGRGLDGVFVVEGDTSRPLRVGDGFAKGSNLRTDVRTRARLTLDDGSVMVLDRGSEVRFSTSQDRSASLVSGALAVDVTSAATAASLTFPGGAAKTIAGAETRPSKFAIRTGGSAESSLTVGRGVVDVGGRRMRSGEGGLVRTSGVTESTAGLSKALAWSELDRTPDIKDGESTAAPGLGELRAKIPGSKGDGDKPLRIARQSVDIKISGDIARTEVEGVFANDEGTVLEGIFRFPLPPDANIERLALDVDGKVEEGAFVDRDRGAAIWRGVMANAEAKRPPIKPPNEEWVWVPGPWHDPALLEWRAGGRMELRIFPIPAKGTRRVILAYTQRLSASGGSRRYVYPLPQVGVNGTKIDEFSLTARLVGHEAGRGVRVAGYEAATKDHDGVVQRVITKNGFVPSGDFVLEYARKDEGSLSTAYAYRAPPPGPGVPAGLGTDAYVSLTLAPKIPRLADDAGRTAVIVVDASRSMTGDRFGRASALAAKVVEELDPSDRFAVLACDVSCTPLSTATSSPGKTAAEDVKRFLAGISPDGASDVLGAIQAAKSFGQKLGEPGRATRVLYVGDGASTIGARTGVALEAGVRAAMSGRDTVNAIAVGVDADTASLEAIVRGGGGALVPYVPGMSSTEVAFEALEAVYGATLRDAKIELPPGLEAVYPTRLPAIRPGSEITIVAKMRGEGVVGNARLVGSLAGSPFSSEIPISVKSSSDAGNAFVPRLWAVSAVADLERMQGVIDKAQIVELSKTFAVPSRYTSLLVLESPAMASAFGVERKVAAPTWTGDEIADRTTTGTPDTVSTGDGVYKEKGGGFASRGAEDAAGATKGPPPAPMAKPAMEGKKADKIDFDDDMPSRRGGGGGRMMRRVWSRTVRFDSTLGTTFEGQIAAARSAVVSSPDSRDKLSDLFGLVSRREDLTEAKNLLTTWTMRDPLDGQAALRRSEMAARDGDRLKAIRVATAALESHPEDIEVADRLAEAARRAGDERLACALSAVHADVKPADVDALVERVRCTRSLGDTALADSLTASLEPARKSALDIRLAATPVTPAKTIFGDLTLDATWTGGADVDLAVLEPKGTRTSWLSGKNIKVIDATSTAHETLALPWLGGGSYAIEVVRATPGETPIRGTINVRILGESRTLSFTLNGPRTTAGVVTIGWASHLE